MKISKINLRVFFGAIFILQSFFGAFCSADSNNGEFDYKKDKNELRTAKVTTPFTLFIYQNLLSSDSSGSTDSFIEVLIIFLWVMLVFLLDYLHYKLFTFFLLSGNEEFEVHFFKISLWFLFYIAPNLFFLFSIYEAGEIGFN